MTKLASLALLAAGVTAQTVNTTVLEQLAGAFQSAGLNTLAAAAATIANTTTGAQLLSTITNGDKNYTIFAPTDEAIQRGNQSVLTDPFQLATLISYHVAVGGFHNETEFFSSPNNTILPTFLNATEFVHLQGNSTQVISATVRDGNIVVNNQPNGTIQVSKLTNVDRFTILEIPRVLTPPPTLETVAQRNNLTLVAQAIQQANLTDAVTDAQGITIFAPTDAALQAALGKLGDAANNQTIIQTILQNHIINGTAIYTSQFDEKNYTSAAGEALNFWVRNNTITVYSGEKNEISANITRRDLLAKNGVIHIIDAVLANQERDDGAASSAYNSATDSANDAKPTGGNDGPSGPIGGTPGGAAAPNMAVAWTAVIGAALVGVLAAASL